MHEIQRKPTAVYAPTEPTFDIQTSIIAAASENRSFAVAALSTFVARQQRFKDRSSQEAVDQISRYLDSCLNAGRSIALATTTYSSLDGKQTQVIGYLMFKTTGDFRDSWLGTIFQTTVGISSPRICRRLFDIFVKPEMPEGQREFIDPLEPRVTKINLSEDPERPHRFSYSWYESERDAPGSIGVLMVAEVDPALRGRGLATKLIKTALSEMRRTGSQYAFTFARCAQLAGTYPDAYDAYINLQSYIALRQPNGLHPDYSIRFHQKAGGTVICGIPNCAEDRQSHDHMCLIIYSLALLKE